MKTKVSSKPRPQVVRLERQDSPKRFWEISRVGAVLTIRFGARSDKGREIQKTLSTEAEAKKLLTKLVEEKRREGYGAPLDLPRVGQSARKGVVASNPEMEALIDASPDDPQAYLVYADWLQQQGDARGELITVQCALAQAPDSHKPTADQRALFKKYGKELLGGLGPVGYRTGFKGLSWRYGFLREVRLERTEDMSLKDRVDFVLSHPSARFLRQLVLGQAAEHGGSRSDYRSTLATIAACAPRTLQSLTIGAGCTAGSLGDKLPALSHVQRLVVCGDPKLDSPTPAQLGELHLLHSTDQTLAHWARVDWSGLSRLEIAPNAEAKEEPPTVGLSRLLARAPNLLRLGAHFQVEYRTNEPVPSEWLLAALMAAKLPRLEHLDLDIGLADTHCLRPFARWLASIPRVSLPIGAVPAADCDAFSRSVPSVEWLEQIPEEASDRIDG